MTAKRGRLRQWMVEMVEVVACVMEMEMVACTMVVDVVGVVVCMMVVAAIDAV